ncbi:MAG: ABC transporter ATP-binding protein [Candidatus Promineifilaceae bacterium]|nr:ABC transporter ATP-binding protein [Candidatus Promineifilaceae bacterium]
MPVQHTGSEEAPAEGLQEAVKGRASAPPARSAALRLKNVSYRYPDGREAVRNVSLNVAAGEKVALAGPNGAGKSTLMLQLNGLLAGEGNVEVGGLAVAEPNLPLIRSKVGVVFQNPDDQLFSPTVFEDVAFGPLHMGLAEEEVARRVEGALAAVEMAGYAGRQPYHLSMGEKKRVALATVLAMDPEILVLDEPSAGLDPRARRALIALLQQLPQTMIVATHDMRLIDTLCPRLVIMDEGRIVADGPTEDLLAAGDLLEAHGLEQP